MPDFHMLILVAAATLLLLPSCAAFSTTHATPRSQTRTSLGYGVDVDHWTDSGPNAWNSASEEAGVEDWETVLRQQQDGSYWSDFDSGMTTEADVAVDHPDDDAEIMLDTLAALQAEDSEFSVREAQRADTARQMEEWGFEASTIAEALDLALEESAEDVAGMQSYREDSYSESVDPTLVESHTTVPRDTVTNEPIRNRMVFVDEHACIGCTNCAMIAQSTFFMEEENGRARVFEQWGDDEATLEIAVDTCPVNCIHYVPYAELEQLEVARRDQYINVVGGLVGRAERGGGNGAPALTPRSFGAKSFTAAPKVSRTYARHDPEVAAVELRRLVAARRQELVIERRRNNKIVDL